MWGIPHTPLEKSQPPKPRSRDRIGQKGPSIGSHVGHPPTAFGLTPPSQVWPSTLKSCRKAPVKPPLSSEKLSLSFSLSLSLHTHITRLPCATTPNDNNARERWWGREGLRFHGPVGEETHDDGRNRLVEGVCIFYSSSSHFFLLSLHSPTASHHIMTPSTQKFLPISAPVSPLQPLLQEPSTLSTKSHYLYHLHSNMHRSTHLSHTTLPFKRHDHQK